MLRRTPISVRHSRFARISTPHSRNQRRQLACGCAVAGFGRKLAGVSESYPPGLRPWPQPITMGGRMTVTFAQKLARLPQYEAGMHEDAAREALGSEDVVKLASNESPWGPHPAVIEAVAGAAKGLNRYPDQHSRRLRRRIAERFDTDPARVAVGNGSCEILLAAAEALCEDGAEIVFAWPSFSIYPHLAALSGAREVRVPLAEGYLHDLDAMLAEVTAATQLLIVCNPNNPTGTHIPAERIGAFVESVPSRTTIILDEAYI